MDIQIDVKVIQGRVRAEYMHVDTANSIEDLEACFDKVKEIVKEISTKAFDGD